MWDDESKSQRATDFKGLCISPFIDNNAQHPQLPLWFLQNREQNKTLEGTEADDKEATIQTARGPEGGGGVLNNQT